MCVSEHNIMTCELHIHVYGSCSIASQCLAGFVPGEGVALGAGLCFSAAGSGVLVRANGTGSFEEADSLSQKRGRGADPSSIIRPGKSPPISVTSIFLIVVSAHDRRSFPEVLMSVQYSRISGSYLSFLGTKSKPSHKSQQCHTYSMTKPADAYLRRSSPDELKRSLGRGIAIGLHGLDPGPGLWLQVQGFLKTQALSKPRV